MDRGKGFVRTGNGTITPEFRDALREHNFKAFMGDNAARQPGTLQEVMLHETVVAWARNLMTKSTPAKPWEESPELFGRRLKEAFAFMNDNYNVEGLSRELPDRVQTLVEADGDRLCK